MFGTCLKNVRDRAPLIHCITNYVTVNDVANMILASGGSPIMADEPQEVAQVTSVCDGLVLNMGTINDRRSESLHTAGVKASQVKHPIVVDPVGIGISDYRRAVADRLLADVDLTVIKGNISEIKALSSGVHTGHGVDASVEDKADDHNLDEVCAWLKQKAADMHCILVATGAIDLIADENVCYVIRNGRSEMSRITGTGCQLTGLIAAFVTANHDCRTEAAAAAVAAMGLAGEIGYAHLAPYEGNATYRNRMIDAVYTMDPETLDQGAEYEVR